MRDYRRDLMEYLPLARTIMSNKWWRGPVDTWVISPEFEAIGHM